MRVIVFGANGTIGSAVVKELISRHEVIKVGRKSGDYQCDFKDDQQIHDLFKKVGKFDAIVSAAGNIHFAPFAKMTPELYQIGLQDKLMGQVKLVLIGKDYISDKGSFTLTSGILSHDPIVTGTSGSMVNGAIDAFVKGAAIELSRGVRINCVSPTILLESVPMYGPYFRGYEPVPAARVSLAYIKSVEGHQTGMVYNVGFS